MLVLGRWAELISGPGKRAYVTRRPAGGQKVCSVQMTGNHTEAKQDKGARRKIPPALRRQHRVQEKKNDLRTCFLI